MAEMEVDKVVVGGGYLEGAACVQKVHCMARA